MTRRDWLGVGIATPALMAKAVPEQPCAADARRTKTAAIVTVYRYKAPTPTFLSEGFSPATRRMQYGLRLRRMWSRFTPIRCPPLLT